MSVLLLRDLWDRILGTTATGASASATGSAAQQLRYAVDKADTIDGKVGKLVAASQILRTTASGSGSQTVTISPAGGGSWPEAIVTTLSTSAGSVTLRINSSDVTPSLASHVFYVPIRIPAGATVQAVVSVPSGAWTVSLIYCRIQDLVLCGP